MNLHDFVFVHSYKFVCCTDCPTVVDSKKLVACSAIFWTQKKRMTYWSPFFNLADLLADSRIPLHSLQLVPFAVASFFFFLPLDET